jgi:hypothetical protein
VYCRETQTWEAEMKRRILVVIATIVAGAIGAVTASSAGGPGPGASAAGITRGNERYVAVSVGASTSIQAIDQKGGRVMRYLSLKGRWGIPLVAFDGTTEGLFPDGRTLLVAQPVIAAETLRKQTSFAFVDIRKMTLLRTIRVKGAFSYDALSPDARYLYLVEYVSDQDFSSYRVRAYDLKANRLLPKIVSDRKSWETTMQGSPVSRLSKDGWAFTLYGGSEKPFIHALDTRHVEAVCIDMPWKTPPQRLFDYRLRTDGDGHLVVRGPRGRALVVIDRSNMRVLSSVRNP